MGPGDQRIYIFTVVNTSVPFRTTLVWTDYPGSPNIREVLVNKLHLSITAPDGTITPIGPENNNVQQVVLNVPQLGTYTVRVVCAPGLTNATETNMKQDFALVVTAGF